MRAGTAAAPFHRSRLTSIYPAAIIPVFPEKRVLGNADEAFIAERMAGLGAYIDKVAHHPVLGASLDLLVFLDGSEAGLEVRGGGGLLRGVPTASPTAPSALRRPPSR